MKFGNQAIYYALVEDHDELAKVLLDYEADVNNQNSYGNTPLHAGTTALYSCTLPVVSCFTAFALRIYIIWRQQSDPAPAQCRRRREPRESCM